MNRPSLRTGQAALPHPALQLVVGLHRRLANAPIARYKVSSNGCLPLPGQPTDIVQRVEGRPFKLLFTCLSPEDILGVLYLLRFVRCLHLPASLGSTSVSSLLGYYGGSVSSRAQFFGPLYRP